MMKSNKRILGLGAASLSLLLAACGGSSSSSSPAPTTPTTPAATPISDLIDAAGAVVGADATCDNIGRNVGGITATNLAGNTVPVCQISGRLSQNATLASDKIWDLSGYVHVGFGDQEIQNANDIALLQANPITLTIQPGTLFQSTGRGSLIITRGSQIDAQGTAVSPIVFSSQDSDFAGRGEWGGLVLQGFAQNNKCPNNSTDAICNTDDEAGTGFHGGNVDDDNSGTLNYVLVAEGGFEVAADSEVNGITFHSVGYGTTAMNIAVHNNADDGVEFFGGSVNVKNLTLTNNGDESIDWDDGYRGNIQFALVVQGTTAANTQGDKGIEADNKGASNTALPASRPTVANVSLIGNADSDDGISLKDGTGATFFNIALQGFDDDGSGGSDGCLLIDDGASSSEETGGSHAPVDFTNVAHDCTSNIVRNDSGNGNLATEIAENFAAGSGAGGVTFDATTRELTVPAPAVAAVTFTSANGSTGFFDNAGATFIGAVDPANTAQTDTFWNWVDVVLGADSAL